MAVTRFTLTSFEFRVMSRILAPHHPRAARELERAASRPGRTAELTEEEFNTLYELAPWGTPTMEVLDRAAFDLSQAVMVERTRPRGTELGVAPHSSFHARRAHKLAKKEQKKNA